MKTLLVIHVISKDFTVGAPEQVEIMYVLRFMTNFSTMDVHVVLGLLLILDLFSHGISGKNIRHVVNCTVQSCLIYYNKTNSHENVFFYF